ncbi:uncharacterized protein LOC115768380 [Drosophila novamexicana]|uniref:uncharacterized protein LOC115768380 n=1 Tax=Drosophila novamexicana TaxID=47314 RepID=UPI0011E5ED8E|nr:uncharacterized protein LOC115768380 [Drosophila novamexicana]XP_030568813.1 uncharacterized protein LOC115768380 [Drosophila novamexicana]
MSRYRYGDLILEAFMEFRRPMALEEVVEYVAEMTDRSIVEVRLPVDNTLTAAWLHGFVQRENDLYSLVEDVRPPPGGTDHRTGTNSSTSYRNRPN